MMIICGVRATFKYQAWGAGTGVGWAFQNTLLRHVRVTLELRHPWLRTVLEGPTHTRALTSELYSETSKGNYFERISGH
uniref:Uncharacterized protein n=1 Tax=Marinobacter nauticus TaxID=2743 RepID=A0A455W619_MARNT|nr:hypothetical protein YBY_27030 [Marinobacter nauticus]